MKNLYAFVAFIGLTLFNANSFASESSDSPYAVVQKVGESVFNALKQQQQSNNLTEDSLSQIVNEKLMPYIDVKFASYKILGSQLKKSTKEERAAFVNAMRTDLVKTYSSVLTQYTDQQVKYAPERPVGNKKTLAVKTELLSPSAPTIDMTFKLRKNKKTGQWKAYDLVVEGISLVDSKRAELSKPLRHKGINHVASLLTN